MELFSNLLYTAIRAEREHEASRRTWLRRLRAIQGAERQKPKERTVIVNKPAHLAGVHKL